MIHFFSTAPAERIASRALALSSALGIIGTGRFSFGIYNNEDDVDKFLELMPAVMADAKDKTEHSPAEPKY